MKKVLSLALAIVMIFSAIPVTASAAESVTTITTAAQLAAIADNLSGNYKLGNDIDLSDYGAWTPIGGSTAFSGTFEGNGKTIKGLTVNTSSQYGGLFGNVSGTVKNLNVKGTVTVNMTSSSATSVYAGLVAGNIGLFGTVDSCSAEGNVSATLSCSASSSFLSSPKGYAYAGGVIGSSSSFYEFSELSHKSGTVTAKASMTNKGNAFAYAGGVAGKSGATITDSYNKGDVTATATASSGETNAYSGGISGYGKNFATSYNTGDVTASGTTVANAGAIAGYATGTAKNCYYLSGCATKAFGGYSADTAPTATALSKTNSYGKSKYVGFDFDNVWESALLNTPKHYDKDEIITGTVAVTGTFQYGNTLTADMSGVTPAKAWNATIKQVKYQWYRGVETTDSESNQKVINYTAISKATSNTYKITADDIGKYIKLVVRGRLTFGGMLESKGTLVEKLTPATPAAPTVERLGDTYVVIKSISGAEYGYATYKEGIFGIGAGWNTPTWQSSNTISGLSPSTKYGLYVRIPESATTNASANSAVTEITTYEEGYDPYAVKGSVSVSGTGAYGNTLTADISGLAAAESGATYSYQWNRDGVAIEDATSKTYKIIAEDIGTKISVTVAAKSPFTGTFTSSAISVSLGQPANLSIKNTDTGITLSWSKVDGATEYVVYKKSGLSWSEVATVTANSYSVGALTSGTTYQYTVSAKRGNVESGKDSTGVKIIYLDKPQNLTADEYTANQATISWSAVSNAKSYNIYRGTATGTLSLLASGVTGTEYQDTTTSKGSTYGYAVAAVSGDYASAQSGRVTIKITGTASHRYNAWVIDKEPTCTEAGSKHRDCTECTDVQTVTIPATGHNYGDWTVTKEATCSEAGAQYRTCSVCSYKEEQAIPTKDHVYGAWVFDESATCVDEGLKHCECTLCGHYKEVIIPEKGHIEEEWIIDSPATVYKAGKKHRNCLRCKETIETVEIPQLKCAKPKLKTIANTQYGVKITWGGVKGADSYRVYRKTKGGSYKHIGSTKKKYYTDKTAKSGKKYYYVIKARNEAGNTSYSNSLSKYHLADPTLKTPSSSTKGIALKWTKITGAEGYIIYRKTGSGSYKKLKVEKGVSNLSYRDTSAKKGKKYTYKVKAYKSKTYSAYSNTKTITDKY
ncbi:MAG: hypothetical protein E7529_06070 [Ruminococcaceae bacterium]|nr:hypothetical protein [Oscillospiraceae bacterium]